MKKRMIYEDFFDDYGIVSLSPAHQLFFIGCIVFADDEGRLRGNPSFLKNKIFPYQNFTTDDVKKIRDEVLQVKKGLKLYKVKDEEYLYFVNWKKFQKIRKDRLKPSILPSPPEAEVKEIKEKEIHQFTEKEIKQIEEILTSIKGYKYEKVKDLNFLWQLKKEFVGIDLIEELEKHKIWRMDKPIKAKSNPRLAIRNWMKIATERKEKMLTTEEKERIEEEELEEIVKKKLKEMKKEKYV